MKLQKTLLATMIAAAFMSNNAYSGDAIDSGNDIANSLNATSTTNETTVGNNTRATLVRGSAVVINSKENYMTGTINSMIAFSANGGENKIISDSGSNTIRGVNNTISGVTNTIIANGGGTNDISGTTTINTKGNASTKIGNTSTVNDINGGLLYLNTNTKGVATGTLIGNGQAASYTTLKDATTIKNTLDVTGAATTAGITNTGNIGTQTLTTSGAATLNSAAITNNATVGGTLGVTGATTTAGITNTGTLTQTGSTVLNGTTSLNGFQLNNLGAGVVGTDAVNLNQLNAAISAIPASVITGGASVVGPSTTTAGTLQANISGTGANVDNNGKISVGTVSQTTASMTVTNGLGNTHGYMVNETQATMSGGMNSTSMTLSDSGARYSNAATGAPVVVTGVANGTSAYDAVNYSQLSQVQSNFNSQINGINNTLDDYAAGMAGITAMTNIPQVDQGKTFAVGMGMGGYDSQGGVALGASFRAAPDFVLKASASTGITQGGNSASAYGMGGAYSW